MVSSWRSFVSECKSPLSAIARSCFLGRLRWYRKCRELRQRLEELRRQAAMLEADRERLEQENRELGERVAELEGKLAQPKPVTLPLGEIPPGQQYGAGMMALCVNLARQIGLRPTKRALHIIFRWLEVQERIPTYQTMRGWMQRIGLDRMQNAKKIAGGVWLTDHTNQIGKEKVLTVLRVRKFRPGVPLRHKDVEVVALVPGQQWKREDVAKVYQETAKRCGDPHAIESDGAVELREPAEAMGKAGKRPFVIRDPKHFLANQLEALLKQDAQYEAFTKQLGGTRSALQQTELAHFIPRNFKIKARFMNLAPTLEWASTMLWHLDHPQSKSRQGITEERLTEKLGWLRDFAPNIRQWQACQDAISSGLTFLNEQGLFRGVATQFKNHVAGLPHNPLSRRLVQKTVKFLRKHEHKLRPGERLPMSTEILESSFSLYKQLEKQHSKSGFTSLLLTFPTLLRPTTPKELRAAFHRVKTADVKKWVHDNLPNTLASKRQLVFRERQITTKAETRKGATSEFATV